LLLPEEPKRPVARSQLAVELGGRYWDRTSDPASGLIPVTLGEVRRLLAHPITTAPARAIVWAWSQWRRTHQHRARTSRYQRRQAKYNEVLLSH